MYEVIPCQDSVAQVRAVRTPYFQYNRYYCVDTTEELFDMVNDKLQMTNLVKNQLYQNVLFQYRIKLDSIRIALNDTVTIENVPCHLVVINSVNPLVQSKVNFPFVFYPIPASDKLFIQTLLQAAFSFELFNSIGQRVKTGAFNFINNHDQTINLENFESGVYLAVFKNAEFCYSSTFTVVK